MKRRHPGRDPRQGRGGSFVVGAVREVTRSTARPILLRSRVVRCPRPEMRRSRVLFRRRHIPAFGPQPRRGWRIRVTKAGSSISQLILSPPCTRSLRPGFFPGRENLRECCGSTGRIYPLDLTTPGISAPKLQLAEATSGIGRFAQIRAGRPIWQRLCLRAGKFWLPFVFTRFALLTFVSLESSLRIWRRVTCHCRAGPRILSVLGSGHDCAVSCPSLIYAP